MPLIKRSYVMVLVAILPVAGCAHSRRQTAEVWTPKPRVGWEHVGAPAGVTPVNGFQILANGPTSGLFPANAAVTRVALTSDEHEVGATVEPQLYADPRNEFLQWNSVFDDQMAVSEVFPIDQRDLGGGPAAPDQILAAFRGLHARLGLIYAVNELSPTQSEMFGVLYNVPEGKPLAAIHAKAESVTLAEEVGPTPATHGGRTLKPDDPYHLWKTDSRALVREEFAKFAHRCVRQLVSQDQPIRSDAPEGWTPAGPIKPVDWPPRRPSHRGGGP